MNTTEALQTLATATTVLDADIVTEADARAEIAELAEMTNAILDHMENESTGPDDDAECAAAARALITRMSYLQRYLQPPAAPAAPPAPGPEGRPDDREGPHAMTEPAPDPRWLSEEAALSYLGDAVTSRVLRERAREVGVLGYVGRTIVYDRTRLDELVQVPAPDDTAVAASTSE
jgi:hypothetical protein